jgi:hypothetical protein
VNNPAAMLRVRGCPLHPSAQTLCMACLGRRGGSVHSPKKAVASRLNARSARLKGYGFAQRLKRALEAQGLSGRAKQEALESAIRLHIDGLRPKSKRRTARRPGPEGPRDA